MNYNINTKHTNEDITLFNKIPKLQEQGLSFLDTIIQHPFIENININLDIIYNCREKIHLILYKFNEYNGNYVVEFYINKDLPFILLMKNDDLTKKINDTVKHIDGLKRVTGNIKYENTNYLFVQVRNNNDYINWLTIGDITVNKHYFGDNLDENITNFFIEYMELSTLKFKRKYCIKPQILYCNISDEYINYIRKTHSIQYCQRENTPLIKLNLYNKNDNIRVLSFIKDREYSTNIDDLYNTDYIIMDNINPVWIFKNEKNIFPYLK